ncbi:MAG: D-glycero-beta-D-manno-heptose 1,7-bisphosphate 7-phosphatase [bacterium]|nr:D-glycero-beta-D-manno-heptose 1,7-bisphosphate 7-phosphatase [bacterium]
MTDNIYPHRAVFLDRDGTINTEVDYLKSVKDLRLIRDAAKAIRFLNQNKIKVIIVTNQSGIGRGLFSIDDLDNVHNELKRRLRRNGAYIDAIYYCPHHPDEECSCRKPKKGMFKLAAKDFDLKLNKCYIIGDKLTDIKVAHNISAMGILVRTGYGKLEQNKLRKAGIVPAHIAENLYDAVKWIIRNINREKNE